MDFPACYVYGGRKRKRNHGNDLRSSLDAHIREHLNLTALRTQDKSLMAWTLGDLAFFCYASAVEAQDSRGVSAAQAVHDINFYDAASFIASERGILGHTSDDILKRVSVNMAARFVKSRLPEALQSFIAEHGPAPCKHPVSHGTGSRPSHINPASGSGRAAAGPMETELVQRSKRVTDRVPRGGCKPSFRNFGTQTWDSLLTPTWWLDLEPRVEPEDQGVGVPAPAQSDELQDGAFRRSCGTQTWGHPAPHMARPSSGQEPKPGAQAEKPQQTAPQVATDPIALPAPPSLTSSAHQAPDPPTQQQPTIATDTVRVGDNDSGVRDTGIKNTGVNNTGASNAGIGSANDWEDTCRMHRAPNMNYESSNGNVDMAPNEGKVVKKFSAAVKCDQQAAPQQLLRLPVQTGPRRSPLRQRQGSLPPPLASPRVLSSQQHKQHPPVILCQRPQQWQRQQQQDRGPCQAAGIRKQEAQQQQEQRQSYGHPEALGELQLARHGEEEREPSAAAAAALALVAGSAPSGAGGHQVSKSSFTGVGSASGAAAAAAGLQCMGAAGSGAPATVTAADTLREPLLSQLRREYNKRLANAALENRLRKHLCKKGNSTIRQYCIKEGMPWTLLEVTCYGVALQKLASQPLEVKSAIEFLARVKGWRPANDGMDIATIEAAEPHRPYELPSSLVQKVATVMAGAISKYSLMDFIERQHRNKPQPRPPPSQQQQEPRAAAQPTVEACRLEPAAPGDALPDVNAPFANAAVLPARAAQVAPATGAWLNAPQQNALLSHANHSPCETVGTGAVMVAGITTAAPSSYLPQHSRSGGSGSSGAGSPKNYATTLPDTAVTSGSGVARRVKGKRSPSIPKRRSRDSSARSKGLEVRLRAHLGKLNVKSLRQCNRSEGVGWTLLDLAEKDRDVRLQMGCEDFRDADVVRRLVDDKVGPGRQLSQAAMQTVSERVRRAYKKYKIGDFVTAEIRKHLQRRRKSSTGDAAEAAPAAVPIGAGGGSNAGANNAGS